MRTRVLLLLLLLAIAGCRNPPVQDEVTIEFGEYPEYVNVTARTQFDSGARRRKPGNGSKRRARRRSRASIRGRCASIARIPNLTA